MAQGKVRCGKCKTVFNARQHLQSPSGPPPSPVADPAPSAKTPDKTAPPADDTDRIDPATPDSEPVSETQAPTGSDAAAEPAQESEPDAESGPKREAQPDQSEPAAAHEPEPEPSDPQSSSAPDNDVTAEVFSQQALDDILAEMDQQLASGGIDSSGPELSDPLAIPDKPASPTETPRDELDEALDTLFDDRHSNNPVEEPLPGIDSDDDAPPEAIRDTADRESDETDVPDEPQSEAPGPQRDAVDAADEAPDASTTSADVDEAVPLRLRDSLAIQPPKRRSWLETFGGGLLILLLLVVLAGQLLLFRPLDVYRLLPQSKPYLEQLCQQLPCRFETYRDPEQIRLLNRDVRTHPEQADALLITAALVNKADYQQAYPDLRVTLFDLSGNRSAQRRFTPTDYLGERYSPFMLMEPGTPLHITLEVVDPGSEAVNFEFDVQ
ncbi:uncharacterized protein DUF3426 [Thiohalophilus thiocyanatoxydans]|uniref:Uncharacterized protein DUF3426 n=2 Tax=Thiohalophilus thiocyanatoxydans TaxID=381308 RepID=A0A4R8IR44_9GAMM|nr:uncharacterized protein DUF3426 [Thiohalophilus thiocyanatoxydans]